MKSKKLMLVFMALVCAVTFAGCGILKTKDDLSAYDKIQTMLLSMQSYESEATVSYISNKKTHTYDTKQQCKITGEYRIEVTGPDNVAGNVTVCDGKVISQYNSRVAGKISIGTTEAMERNELFLTSFVKNYVKSQDVSVTTGSVEETACTVLEATIPGEHPYLRAEKLWVDNGTLKPVKLVIFDPEGNERIVVTYKTFEYNVTLEDSIFTVQ